MSQGASRLWIDVNINSDGGTTRFNVSHSSGIDVLLLVFIQEAQLEKILQSLAKEYSLKLHRNWLYFSALIIGMGLISRGFLYMNLYRTGPASTNL